MHSEFLLKEGYRTVCELTFLSSWFDYAFSFVGGSFGWRFPLAFQVVFAFIVVILLYDLPESPRWLFKKNCPQEAVEVLCRVFDEKEDSEFIQAEKHSINTALELESQESSASWMSLFQDDAVKTRRRILLAYAVMVFHQHLEFLLPADFTQIMDQATGINLVVFYVPCEYFALVARLATDKIQLH